MDAATFDKLLYSGESEILDFKRDQYKFEKPADELQKSELLKDILAFANAWRVSEAHILIGVQEVRGQKSIVYGITKHLADNELQQFVNSKTQRPLSFRYEGLLVDGKQVAVISIPVQTRPFFIRKNFGIVDADKVYLRRGSSTDIATADEIFAMGQDLKPTSVALFRIKTAIGVGARMSIHSEIWLDSWIVNIGKATAYDLQICFENEPRNRYEFNHMIWEDKAVSQPHRGQSSMGPLHRGANQPIVSWSLGHPGSHEQMLEEGFGRRVTYGRPVNYSGGQMAIGLTILARDLPPLKTVIEYSEDEIRTLTAKTFELREG